ncbi:MAG TPA: roadblock/LC7 domain-containing protein [Methanoregula sp.]|nr:roadblock/LC7 domain-containing protein [Methanoregula sp.]
MAVLKEILNKFLILNGVQAAMVVQENGEIIESMKSGIRLDEEMQGVIATLMLDSKATATSFGDAPLSMLFVEYADYFLIIGPVMEEFFLFVIAKNTANIGQITYAMKKNQEEIVSSL